MAGSRTDHETASAADTDDSDRPDDQPAEAESTSVATVAEQVRILAAIEGRTAATVVRDALVAHVERRRDHPDFRRLLEESRARHDELLRDFEVREDLR